MTLLALETSTSHSSVALLAEGRLQAEEFFPSQMSLGRTLPGHIQAVLATCGLGPEDLQGIAVAIGPGSFTGMRVGVATAKALAHGLEIPLVGIPTHETLAWPLCFAGEAGICVIQHARKTDVYTTTFSCSGDGPVESVPCAVVPLRDLLERIARENQPPTLVGDGVERHAAQIAQAVGEKARVAPGPLSAPRAAVVGAIAQTRIQQADTDAAFSLRPMYVLASQAERTHGIDLGMG